MRLSRRAVLAQGLAVSLGVAGRARAAGDPGPLWQGVSAPAGMGFDAAGHLFVAEWGAGRISRFAPDGRREVFAEGLPGPSGLAIAADGTIFVASYADDLIWRFTADGHRRTHVTGLATPAGLSFDRAGRLMVANRRSHEILTVEDDGPKPLIDGLNTPVGVVQTPDGGYVVSNIGGGVTVLRPDGRRIEAGQAFATPGSGIALTADGRVFVVDYGGTTVREILRTGSSRRIADGLSRPVGLVVTPDQKALLCATWGDGTIFRIPLERL
ncbi:NHL repeat-containing protein [Pseudodonghicola flavimaris]|uniref:NHL repeat-containing protein n=1 Tax=Pseudodonghicola flavimaris TaxID=3050036 RepID=A0ABT7F2Q7_9RHOB|nr:NHL repeat-containing protein [Pseudodonghicola flavimaris]MDK3018800.1 NHL repeat-containing protein [Pseudodonghicola flavimaris]